MHATQKRDLAIGLRMLSTAIDAISDSLFPAATPATVRCGEANTPGRPIFIDRPPRAGRGHPVFRPLRRIRTLVR